MIKRKGYIFTNKKHSERGMMSTILGMSAIITLGIAIYLSYLNEGAVSARHGAAALLAVVFMVAGLVLGLWSATEREKFRLFTVLGITVNVLAFCMLSIILSAGAYID